jgi:hypothetical protein
MILGMSIMKGFLNQKDMRVKRARGVSRVKEIILVIKFSSTIRDAQHYVRLKKIII